MARLCRRFTNGRDTLRQVAPLCCSWLFSGKAARIFLGPTERVIETAQNAQQGVNSSVTTSSVVSVLTRMSIRMSYYYHHHHHHHHHHHYHRNNNQRHTSHLLQCRRRMPIGVFYHHRYNHYNNSNKTPTPRIHQSRTAV